jgi:very-short-patch-repair endonuclease
MGKKFGFDLLVEQLLDSVASEFDLHMKRIGTEPFESEIERLFYFALSALHVTRRFGHFYEPDAAISVEEWCEHVSEQLGGWSFPSLIIRKQVKTNAGRVDFIISAPSGGTGPIKHLVVECDGHDYHDRTKEQAAHDKARDRQHILDGMEVFRFTGSELWRDPIGCAEQVVEWIEKIIYAGTEDE